MTFENEKAAHNKRQTTSGWVNEHIPLVGNYVSDSWVETKENLRENREKTAETFQKEFDQIQEEFETVAGRVEQSMVGERDIYQDERDEITETLHQVSAGLQSLNKQLNHEFLLADELRELRHFMVEVGVMKRFADAKVAFDQTMETTTPQIDALANDIGPYQKYQQFLKEKTEIDLETRIEKYRDRLVSLEREIDLEILDEKDIEQFKKYRDKLQVFADLLTDYNQSFVEKEIEKYENVFEEVGDGHNFNTQQRKAVVRNSHYNQVVAAAGTGKTDVLTCRILYLTQKGVDPDEIVALTFTKKAAKEIRERVNAHNVQVTKQIENPGATIVHYHSFGNQIVKNARPVALDPVKSDELKDLIEDLTNRFTEEESDFSKHYYEYLVHYDDDFLDETDFESKEKYLMARRKKTYETLKEETVRTKVQKQIADFLYRNQIEYQYDQPISWMDEGRGNRRYEPDFYLPKYDVYIEYWGLDENKEPLSWIDDSDRQYLNTKEWVTNQYAKHDQTVLNIYDYQFESSGKKFEKYLENLLEDAEIELNPLSYKEFVERTYEYGEMESEINGLFAEFIQNAKTFGIAPEEIPKRLSKSNQRQYHFGQCGRILLKEYDAYLGRHDKAIDFADMIHRAAEIVRDFPEKYQNRVSHILVDEFQDTSTAVIRLLQGFQGDGQLTHLFAVGDDWQSIYSFQGASVDHFLNFGEYFGQPEMTFLDKNYRCPETVLDVGTKLMEKIPDRRQLGEKPAPTAESGRDTDPEVHEIIGDGPAYTKNLVSNAADTIEEYLEEREDAVPGEIMVLSRYDSKGEYLPAIKKELKSREIPWAGKNVENGDWFDPSGDLAMLSEEKPNAVSVFSIHQAKGKEADHVLYLHASEGFGGIPSPDRTSDVVKPVKDNNTIHQIEERRLFYVAITRAMKTLDIYTKAAEPSPFLNDVEDQVHWNKAEGSRIYQANDGEYIDVEGEIVSIKSPKPKQKQRGEIQIGQVVVEFVSWKGDNPPAVNEGSTYQFESLKVNDYKDKRQLFINKSTKLNQVE